MSEPARCIHCDRDSDQVPLIAIQYRGVQVWICPQHLPILIHKPAELADKLPGLELLDTENNVHHH